MATELNTSVEIAAPPVAVDDKPKAPRALKPSAYGISDIGKVRTTNEDQFLIAELVKSMSVWQTTLSEPRVQVGDERAHLFLVADGMGGSHAGERASALAVLAIEQFTLNTFKWFLGSDNAAAQKVLAQFGAALTEADARIRAEAASRPHLEGMGTTVTLAFHLGTQLCVVHAGDSRAYLYRGGQLNQLTQDHTMAAELARRGEVAGNRFHHVITNVVGGQNVGVKVEAHAFEVQAGDCLVLCSDGLTNMVKHEEIAATLGSEATPELVAKKLLALAHEAGAHDNITVVVARFD